MKSFRSKPVGWKGESHRHYLAAKGIQTAPKKYHAHKYYYTPTYVAADLPLIAADGIGTVGASAVAWAPIVVPLALAYGGATLIAKRKKERAKQGKGFFAEKHEELEGDDLEDYLWDEGIKRNPDFMLLKNNPIQTAAKLSYVEMSREDKGHVMSLLNKRFKDKPGSENSDDTAQEIVEYSMRPEVLKRTRMKRVNGDNE